MTRRKLAPALLGGAAAMAMPADEKADFPLPPGYSVRDMGGLKHFVPPQPEHIVMLIYPGMTALDLIGPQQAFGYLMDVKVDLVWKTSDPITTDTGVKITPSLTFKDLDKPADLIFVPGGGKGTVALMTDETVLDFLVRNASGARYITSVCSGSLVLGAAGLLRGYRATSHWAVRAVLPTLGAELASGRIVEDRNRITAGGVTAGIDFGLYLAAKLRGEDYARALDLMLEYDPHPPFHSGTPEEARPDIRDVITRMYAPLAKAAQNSADTAKSRWAKS
jgi:cyclohexyl-isocyanide hydratase